jgi:hypothetical protein
MPNITFTSAYFEGPQESIAKLRALLTERDDRTVSDIIIPIPVFPSDGKSWFTDADAQAKIEAMYKTNQAICGYQSDYDFVNDVWGSKWGICDICFGHTDANSLSVSWQSAWSPAYGLFYIIARMFPDVLCMFDNDDECNNYEPHAVYLKNPQPILGFILNQRTEHRDILGKDVFSLLDPKSRSCAYIVQEIKKYEVTDEKGNTTIKDHDKMTEEDWESDYEDASEAGPVEATEGHMAMHYLKAEMYINGFNSAIDMLIADHQRVNETRSYYPQPPKKTE